jgi:hypothetical protein
MACQDLSGFVFLTQSQLRYYKTSVQTFNRVQDYNSNISTLRSQGDSTLSYYQFISLEEKNNYTKGLFLLTQSHGSGNIQVVQQN